ncbi:transmembrane protein [Cystoisospora suis]|uniref:Transmembrane protein n=1 Tax=Cystoisospora suis TaxID=483139 RepID=A0A2C6L485_9APIC|nr:transmembrane protein [Cystoisospora suis]
MGVQNLAKALTWALVFASVLTLSTTRDGGSSPGMAAEASVVKSLKRAVSQEWRVGARSICSILGCDYETVKSRLSGQPSYFVTFKALSAQMDHFNQMITTRRQGEADLTPDQRKARWLLLTKVADILNQALGTEYSVPPNYVPEDMQSRQYQYGAAQSPEVVEKASQHIKSEVHKLQVTVPLPTTEDLQNTAREKLSGLRGKHQQEIAAVEESQRQKLLLLQEEHDRQTHRLLTELKIRQVEEAETLRAELTEERRFFDQNVKIWEAVSDMLTQARTILETLSERVHVMGTQVFKLSSFHEKLTGYQQSAKSNPESTAAYTALGYAFQSEAAVVQAMEMVTTSYRDTTAIAAQVQEILNAAENAMGTVPQECMRWFEAQQRGYKDRLESFNKILSDLTTRTEDYLQTAEEKKLVTIFAGDEVRLQILALLQERVSGWNTQLVTIRERTAGIETAATRLMEGAAQLDRSTLEAVSSVLQQPDGFLVHVGTYSTETATLRESASRIEEDIKTNVKDLQEVERAIRSVAENVAGAQLPPAVLDYLGIPALVNSLQVDMQLKQNGTHLVQLIRGRLNQLSEVMRKLELLRKEVKNLKSPADREQAEWSLNEIMKELQDVTRTKSEVELQVQQVTLEIQQLQAAANQLEQRMALERRTVRRNAPGRTMAGGVRGTTFDGTTLGGLGGTAQGVGTIMGGLGDTSDVRATIAELEDQLRKTRQQVQERRQDLSNKQREAMSLENTMRRLETEIATKQREQADEQQRVARILSLAQAISGSGGPAGGVMSMASMAAGLGGSMPGALMGSAGAGLLSGGMMGSMTGSVLGGSVAGLGSSVAGGVPGLGGGMASMGGSVAGLRGSVGGKLA